MAGVIAMTAVLLVVGIEMFLRTRGVVHSHSHMEDWEKDSTDLPLRNHRNRKMSVRRRPDNIAMENLEASQGLMNGASPSPGSLSNMNGSSKHGQEEDGNDSDLNLDELDPRGDLSHDIEQSPRGHMHSLTETEEEEQKRLVLQCMLLEAGILFHSVFIGMALSVATGTPFVIFLIAICFHQTFEGMALGSRIAAIKFPRRSVKPWIMVLAYGATTPIGQAIGLGVHTLYDPRSEAGLLMVGIMNAISSGLLLFAGLVQLLAEDFLSDKSYGVLKGSKRLQAYIAVISGAALMSLVGAWA
jgi:zinc transporter 1/2/3